MEKEMMHYFEWLTCNFPGTLTVFQKLSIALKMKEIQMWENALVLHDGPGALESIAMELGSARDGDGIKQAIKSIGFEIVESINTIGTSQV